MYRRVRDEIREFIVDRLPALVPGLAASAALTAAAAASAAPIPAAEVAPAADVAPSAGAAAKEDGRDVAVAGAAPVPPVAAAASAARPRLSCFDAYLSLWVLLCIVAGTLIGYYAPSAANALAAAQVSQTSIPIAVLLWLMIFPMLLQIDFAALRHVGRQPGALLLTTGINFAIQPFTMYALALLFFRAIYTTVIPDRKTQDEYIAGAVLLGGAPCTAMVFVWSLLVGGSPGYTLMQVRGVEVGGGRWQGIQHAHMDA